MAKDNIKNEEKPDPTDKEKFGIKLFKLNHKCSFLKELEEANLTPTDKNKIRDEMCFKITVKSGGGIGIVTKVICNACDEEFNVTDYDNW